MRTHVHRHKHEQNPQQYRRLPRRPNPRSIRNDRKQQTPDDNEQTPTGSFRIVLKRAPAIPPTPLHMMNDDNDHRGHGEDNSRHPDDCDHDGDHDDVDGDDDGDADDDACDV